MKSSVPPLIQNEPKISKKAAIIDQTQNFGLKWKGDLEKCIDACPVLHRKSGLVLIGSHRGIFAAFNAKSGDSIWTTMLDDRIGTKVNSIFFQTLVLI